jgi:hypothetical protein
MPSRKKLTPEERAANAAKQRERRKNEKPTLEKNVWRKKRNMSVQKDVD